MTDSENSLPEGDSDVDIYKDFPEFNFEDELAKLEGSNKVFKQEAIDLSEKVKFLSEENEELKKLNETLGKNLSILLKTAQAEVKRKDSMIEELRSKVDSFAFRRNNKITKDKFTSTDDLKALIELKMEARESKFDKEKKRSKSYETKTSSDSEHKFVLEEKKKESSDGATRIFDCDKDRRLNYRDNSKSSSRHSGNNYNRFSERSRGSSYLQGRKEQLDYKRHFRHDHRDHTKYDSLDKKRHSRRPPHRRKREESTERRRRESRRNRDRSRSRERSSRERSRSREGIRSRSSGKKDCSSEKLKSQSCLPKDYVSKSKEQVNDKKRETLESKVGAKIEENSRRGENSEKRKSVGEGNVEKHSKEKRLGTNEKGSNFEMTSPLDDLYSESLPTRTSKPAADAHQPDSELEDIGDYQSPDNSATEDWTLSFKNERKNENKPLTLYSKRMMQKLMLQSKQPNDQKLNERDDEKEQKEENQAGNIEKKEPETEKEPGELTDDENIVESSKEFQEIAKVASIKSSLNENTIKITKLDESKEETVLFKEPVKRIPSSKTKPKEHTLLSSIFSESVTMNENFSESNEINEKLNFVEFSPFKNNYKLIAISPIKPPETQHILDFYNKRKPSNSQTQKEVETSVFSLLSSLSGVAIKGSNKIEKIAVKESEITKVSKPEKGEVVSDVDKNPDKDNKQDIKDNDSKTELEINKETSTESSKPKKIKNPADRDKGKEILLENKNSEESTLKNKNRPNQDVKNPEVSSTTPHLLNNFISASTKPLNPEKFNSDSQSKNELNSSEEKSETEKATSEGSIESESRKSSSSEKKSEEKVETDAKNAKPKLRPKRGRNSEENKSCSDEKERKMEKSKEKAHDLRSKKKKTTKTDDKVEDKQKHRLECKSDSNLGRGKRRSVSRKESKPATILEKSRKRKRESSAEDGKDKTVPKKLKPEERESPRRVTRSKRDSKSEPEVQAEEPETKPKEDITSFEFFKPITKEENSKTELQVDLSISSSTETKSKTMSITEITCLETPHKSLEKLKNVMINEQVILDTRNRSLFSPLIGSKSVEMTPRRLLKNDLTLTDSEDDSVAKPTNEEEKPEEEDVIGGEYEYDDDEDEEVGSDSDSDSGASDFVDLL